MSARNGIAREIARQMTSGSEMPCQTLCGDTEERCERCLQWRYRVLCAESALIAAEMRGVLKWVQP